MENHLWQEHADSVNSRQIPVFLDMCERPIDLTTKTSCSFCPEEMDLSKLLNHLAEHLEELSLFVLPIQVTEDDEETGDVHSKKVNPVPNSDELSELVFAENDISRPSRDSDQSSSQHVDASISQPRPLSDILAL